MERNKKKKLSRKKSCKKFNFFSLFLLHFLCCSSIASHRRHREILQNLNTPNWNLITKFLKFWITSRHCYKWSRNLFWMARRWKGKKKKIAKKLENVDENWWKEFTGANYTALCCVLKPVFTPCVRFRCCCRMPPLLMYFSLFSFAAQQILENSCFWVANGNVIIISFVFFARAFSYFEISDLHIP